MEGLPRMQWGLTTSLSPITDTPDSPPSAKHLLHTHLTPLLALQPLPYASHSTLPTFVNPCHFFLAAKGVTLAFFSRRGTAHPVRITTCLFLLKNNPVNFRKQLRHSNGAKAHNNGGAVWRKQGGGQRVFFTTSMELRFWSLQRASVEARGHQLVAAENCTFEKALVGNSACLLTVSASRVPKGFLKMLLLGRSCFAF